MAILLVTYDLKQPGRNYQPIYDYLKTFTFCKGLDSVWLLDTAVGTAAVRDKLQSLIDSNDVVFVTRLSRDWGAYNYYCATWLNDAGRNLVTRARTIGQPIYLERDAHNARDQPQQHQSHFECSETWA